MAILDTSLIIDFLRKDEYAFTIVQEKQETCAIAAVTVAELWLGTLKSVSDAEKKRTEEFIGNITIIPFDEQCAKIAAQIEYDLTKKGLKIGIEDMQIAATAIAQGDVLVTRDADFARIEGLRILKY